MTTSDVRFIFGYRLRQLREDKNYSLRDLSEELNISFSALGKYERNEQQPNFETLIKIANYYNVSVDWLLGQSDIKNYKSINEDIELMVIDRLNLLLDEIKNRNNKLITKS